MARSTATIKALIVADIQADPILSTTLTSPSATALWNIYAYVVAQSINIFEQLIDVFKADIEAIAARSYYGTSLWWKSQMTYFQYSASNPQVIQIIDNTITYPIVDESLRIITACSVPLGSNGLTVKVAQGEPGAYFALTSPQLTAAQDYAVSISPAGVNPNVVSINADKILIAADIYYLGQYVAASVLANVITAINTYLSVIGFDGVVYVAKLQDAIQGVDGVKDVVLTSVIARTDAQIIADGTGLVVANAVVNRNYSTLAGYIIGEDTAGSTFNDTLNMVAA